MMTVNHGSKSALLKLWSLTQQHRLQTNTNHYLFQLYIGMKMTGFPNVRLVS